MLPLTPLPPQTDGERAFFAELVRWDTGNAVRGAVMASIPFSDGPLQRRLSDAILFVPEGIAVVRVAEVVRQSGVVTASPEGPWTIGPPGTGGAVLQLGGGGSTPLDGLMRAGMETAVRLRQAGLEPGRIARLTVLVGDVEGLLPADGDLGEGDQVALLETRSLLLGIARASRYSGVDNPRLWTTADVRAALEALGLQGRGPSVQELNGEGFPYSPYVLRRPQLLTPAAMAASPAAAGPEAPVAADPAPPAAPPPAPSQPAPSPPVSPQPAGPSREAIEQAVAASVAAAHAAAAAEASAASAPPAGTSTTSPVPGGAPPVPGASPDAGIGGLFGRGEPDTPAPPPHTRVLPAGGQSTPAAPPPFWDSDQAGEEPRSSGRGRVVLLALAAALLLFLAGFGVWFALADRSDEGRGTAAPSEPAQETEPAGPEIGSVQEVDGIAYTVEAVQLDETCADHAYGATADHFAEQTDCTGLSRALYSAEVGGRDVVVSVARVRMPDTAAARVLRSLTDTARTGNVNDLLKEGVTYPGGPTELDGAEYASAVSGPTVTIVESAWVDPDAGGTSAEIDQIATSGLSLPTPAIPAD